MASEVSICSAALVMNGAQPLTSFTENNDSARIASALWESARDYVLRAYPWNCAVKRVQLAPSTTAPEFDYSAQFTLPDDWLRTLQVGLYGEEIDYRTEGNSILCDATSLPLRYIYRNANCESWDAGLVWAMTNVMRSIFANPVTSSTSLEDLVHSVLKPIIQRASAIDGADDPPAEVGDYPLIQARHQGLTRGW